MDWFIDCITKNYVNFSGRARRKEYWMFNLFNIIACFVVMLLDSFLELNNILILIYVLAILLPSYAVTVRRLHDTDKSGWWLLLMFVPFGNIILLIFCLIDSTPGPNQYGENPKRF
ncbi:MULTISPECIES: DUF805 domain-containing protein [Gilliamella]|uniref:DUF805 domain-containing protein n=1 Tax=Gilliamella apicola TaxID=1196095 RepID=A0A556SBG3_9GAMM|nr:MULTISPECIES: DUF805 domain-containing protein [Gilliamella]MBI0028173.1 DUF805 domain-containing protein [Gilliamella sp. B14448G7]MBI0034594.1 DUF805 domain-containing protein [Gilliamella sp. B14448G11]MBI0042090.1 DUF805 domain-containing protein [Gilliamella sp. B14448G12]MBI0095380.1 DUF805 domain-containing protein [Gilliamella sp. W8136]TSJ98486.1 DUF805 domain-containing protein [Gilliamella apicola]